MGKSVREAVAILERNGWGTGDTNGDGYTDDYSWTYSAPEGRPDWIVCGQKYDKLADGTSDVSLDAAPTPACSVKVPDVVAKTVRHADASADAVGLLLDEDFKNEVTLEWIICYQDPPAGRNVNPATQGILSVSVAPRGMC